MSKYCTKLVTKEINTGGISTAAVISCIACGSIIAGMGGGGDHLCDPCYHVIRTGKFRRQFRQALPPPEKADE